MRPQVAASIFTYSARATFERHKKRCLLLNAANFMSRCDEEIYRLRLIA
jgi:hypothetical protein